MNVQAIPCMSHPCDPAGPIAAGQQNAVVDLSVRTLSR